MLVLPRGRPRGRSWLLLGQKPTRNRLQTWAAAPYYYYYYYYYLLLLLLLLLLLSLSCLCQCCWRVHRARRRVQGAASFESAAALLVEYITYIYIYIYVLLYYILYYFITTYIYIYIHIHTYLYITLYVGGRVVVPSVSAVFRFVVGIMLAFFYVSRFPFCRFGHHLLTNR